MQGDLLRVAEARNGREIFDYGRSRNCVRTDRCDAAHEDLLVGMVSYLRGARVVVRAVCDCECWCAAVRNCLQCGELGGGGEWTWLVYGRERGLGASLVYLNDAARSATSGVRAVRFSSFRAGRPCAWGVRSPPRRGRALKRKRLYG